MLSPNVGSQNVELRVTAEDDLMGVVVDDAAAAIGVLLPAFARERYWYRWLRWDEPAGEEPDQLARIPAYCSSGTPAERAAVPSARSRVASGASSRRASSR